MLDLYDVLLTTSDQEFRRLHYDNLVEHYYEVLSDSIRKLGSDPAKLMTFGDLLLLLKKFAKYGTFMTLATFILALPEDDVIPSGEQFSRPLQELEETVFPQFIEATRDVTCKRINDLFTDLVAWGYLSSEIKWIEYSTPSCGHSNTKQNSKAVNSRFTQFWLQYF